MKYNIYIPSGNPTALVVGIPCSMEERKNINDQIMKENKIVEQVGFLNPDNKELIMAGGEFCGNATRCAIKYYLKDKEGTIKIKVSGVPYKLTGGIKNNLVWVEMPIIKSRKSIEIIDDNIAIVKLLGITHLVIKNRIIKSKKQAFKLLEKYNLTNNSAAGVISYKKNINKIRMSPHCLC